MTIEDGSTAKLLTTSQRWFKTIRIAVLQRACAEEIRDGTVSSRRLVLLHVRPPHDGLRNLSQDLPQAIFAATQDADRQIRESALKWVIDHETEYFPRAGRGFETIDRKTDDPIFGTNGDTSRVRPELQFSNAMKRGRQKIILLVRQLEAGTCLPVLSSNGLESQGIFL